MRLGLKKTKTKSFIKPTLVYVAMVGGGVADDGISGVR